LARRQTPVIDDFDYIGAEAVKRTEITAQNGSGRTRP
jgi:hypothetical protein